MKIRNGGISREEGVRIVEKYDGKYPKECIEEFCDNFKITLSEFDQICQPFINTSLFVFDGINLKRDIDGSLVLKEKYINARRNP